MLPFVFKCYEKMACTYFLQEYTSVTESIEESTRDEKARMYEKIMSKSLSSYTSALRKVEELERDGKMFDQRGGGSSSGTTEAFYRLHASRLKILIRAVRRKEDERHPAELEAIRLLLKDQAKEGEESKDDEPHNEKYVRNKIWELFGDLATAMAQCRDKDPFFHRSVYRHAQALLLAPIVNDPYDRDVYRLGSLGSIPITRAYHLRGLSSDSCAKSAASIIAALFDKKRYVCSV